MNIGKIIKIILSIVISFVLLRFGYESENEYTSLILQSLGYVFISYPFFLFFKTFIGLIIHEIKNIKNK